MAKLKTRSRFKLCDKLNFIHGNFAVLTACRHGWRMKPPVFVREAAYEEAARPRSCQAEQQTQGFTASAKKL